MKDKKLNQKQAEQLEALASIAECVTDKDVLEKKEIQDISSRLDQIIASVTDSRKFFKRLL
jgi:hypothetical protein